MKFEKLVFYVNITKKKICNIQREVRAYAEKVSIYNCVVFLKIRRLNTTNQRRESCATILLRSLWWISSNVERTTKDRFKSDSPRAGLAVGKSPLLS